MLENAKAIRADVFNWIVSAIFQPCTYEIH